MAYTGPVIDVHTHIAFTENELGTDSHRLGLDGLVDAVRIDRVEHAVAIVMARRDQAGANTERNDRVLAAARDSGGFVLPMVSVHPYDGDAALAELDRVAAAGAKLLKLHPNSQSFDVADERVSAVVGRAGELGITTLFDGWNPFDGDQPGKFLNLAMANQDSRLIIAHFGGMEFAKMMVFEIAARYPFGKGNVYFDLSAIGELLAGSPFQEQFVWTVRKVGVDKVLYGSDWPVCDPRTALAAFHALGFTEDEERRILHDNAAELLAL